MTPETHVEPEPRRDRHRVRADEARAERPAEETGARPEDATEGMCVDVANGWSAKRVVLVGLGWVFIGLGIAGLVLPVLQGFLFLAIGLLILSRQSAWVCSHIERLRVRHPRLDHGLKTAERKAHAWWSAIKGRLRRGSGRDS